MAQTEKRKELKRKRTHLFEAFVWKHNKDYHTALKSVIKLTGGYKGIPQEMIQAAKVKTEYKPYQDAIFEGAGECGAPRKNVKKHFATVGIMENGCPVSVGAYMSPYPTHAKTRAEHRAKAASQLDRALDNSKVLFEQGIELTPAQTEVIKHSDKALAWSDKHRASTSV